MAFARASRGVGVIAAAAIVLAGLVGATPAAADTPSPGVRVTDTSIRSINAATTPSVKVFSADITTGSVGEQRFVSGAIVTSSATARLFTGVVVSCSGPPGSTTQTAEAGRNVWQRSGRITIPVGFVLSADVPGTWTCTTTVNVCQPGACPSGPAKGRVPLVTGATNASFLSVSGALPSWAADSPVPGKRDVRVQPGRTTTSTATFDLSALDDVPPLTVGAVLSVTNCIVAEFPAACGKVPSSAVRRSATAVATLTVTQAGETAGVVCATATQSTRSTITWQQHHAILVVGVPSLTLSEDPGCADRVTVTVTLAAGRGGNPLVLEGGTQSRTTSVAYVVPAGTLV